MSISKIASVFSEVLSCNIIFSSTDCFHLASIVNKGFFFSMESNLPMWVSIFFPLSKTGASAVSSVVFDSHPSGVYFTLQM